MITAHQIALTLLQAGAVLLRPEQPFTFASGLRSPVYCDNRLLLGDVAARRVVASAFAAHAGEAEVLAGPATGGIPWAAWVSEELGLPMAYVRASAKGHGRGQQIEGAPVRGRQVVLLEDTVSTGESVLAAAVALREQEAELVRCVCIFTWDWAATDARFDALALPLVPLATLADVLVAATETGKLSEQQRGVIEDWGADPQAWSEAHQAA